MSNFKPFPLGVLKEANIEILSIYPEYDITHENIRYTVRFLCCGRIEKLTHEQVRRRRCKRGDSPGPKVCTVCKHKKRTETMKKRRLEPGKKKEEPEFKVPAPDPFVPPPSAIKRLKGKGL